MSTNKLNLSTNKLLENTVDTIDQDEPKLIDSPGVKK